MLLQFSFFLLTFPSLISEGRCKKSLDRTSPVNCLPPILFIIARTDAEAPILWPPDVKSRLIGKDPDAGTDWGQEEKGATEDVMFAWHTSLKGYEFEQTQRDSEGQGSLECCSPWGRKELDMTYWVKNNKGSNKTVNLSWMFPCVVLPFIMSERHAFKVNYLPFFKYLKNAVFLSILVQSRENQNTVFKRCFHSDFSLWL